MKKPILAALTGFALSATAFAKSGRLSDTVTVCGATVDDIALAELMKDPSVECHLAGYHVASFRIFIGRPKLDVRSYREKGAGLNPKVLDYLKGSPSKTRVFYDDIILSNGKYNVKTRPITLKLK
jgi:hypothetical protein